MSRMEEQVYDKPFDWKIWKKLGPFLKKYRVRLFLIGLTMIVSSRERRKGCWATA